MINVVRNYADKKEIGWKEKFKLIIKGFFPLNSYYYHQSQGPSNEWKNKFIELNEMW